MLNLKLNYLKWIIIKIMLKGVWNWKGNVYTSELKITKIIN